LYKEKKSYAARLPHAPAKVLNPFTSPNYIDSNPKVSVGPLYNNSSIRGLNDDTNSPSLVRYRFFEYKHSCILTLD